jgi:hypothetical protein
VFIALLIGLFWTSGLSDLAKVQFGISLQCIPTFFVGLFGWGATDCHPWSLAAGGLVGCVMTFSLYFTYIKEVEDSVPMDAGVTSTFFNVVLVFLIEIVRRLFTGTLFGSKSDSTVEEKAKLNSFNTAKVEAEAMNVDIPETDDNIAFSNRPTWDKPKTTRFGERPLTPRLVWKSMEGTWEPLTNPALVFLLFFIITVAVPLIPEDMPPLNEDGSFLFPPATVNGIPHWALKMMMISLVGTIAMLAMVYHMPDDYGLESLDPDTVDLLPDEMNKRKIYDEQNAEVSTRRMSIVESIELIKQKEAHSVDYTHRRRVSQLMMGVPLSELEEDAESEKGNCKVEEPLKSE